MGVQKIKKERKMLDREELQELSGLHVGVAVEKVTELWSQEHGDWLKEKVSELVLREDWWRTKITSWKKLLWRTPIPKRINWEKEKVEDVSGLIMVKVNPLHHPHFLSFKKVDNFGVVEERGGNQWFIVDPPEGWKACVFFSNDGELRPIGMCAEEEVSESLRTFLIWANEN